jgi:hypothetical protein
LRATRHKILAEAGYEAVSVSEWEELVRECSARTFDLVILGQSLTPSFKQNAADFILRHCARTAILEIYVASPVLGNEVTAYKASSRLDPEKLL